jgi:D-alanine-D-alanine ligase-like ATP-grasp enzyme
LDDVYAIAGNVGHPHPGFELQVVDAKDRPLPAGEAGLVRIRSATGIDGYLNDPIATAEAFRDGWFYPGDLGRLAAGGQLIHLGRADDLMIMNGINIYPAEIEQTLLIHPAVRDAAAMPIRHPVHQDVPVAVVSLHPGADAAAQDLLRFVHDRIGAHALHQIFILEEIPRNEQGKPRRDDIRAQIAARSQAAAEIVPKQTEAPKPTRQLARRLERTFRAPERQDIATVDRWLQILEDDLPAPPAPSNDSPPDRAELARLWLARCLRLARLLLQELRAPVFAAPNILDCIAEEGDGGGWRGQFELALVDGVPLTVYATALDAAFLLAEWATSHEPTPENRETFFAMISERVLIPCEKLQPTGKSTFQVLRVANRLGIPFRALGNGVYQLGWGAKARRIDRSMTDGDSLMGISLSSSKPLTAQLLRAAGLPAPVHAVVGTIETARAAAERLGWPVVVKPADRDRGEGVTVDVHADGLQSAFAEALQASREGQVIVERQVAGVCHRLFVMGGSLLYAVKRLPIGVYGDGSRSVAALVEDDCAAQQLKPPWKRSGIGPVDELARAALAAAGMTDQSVPPTGQFVPLRRIESTAWGGVDEEVTSSVHPENLRVALAATALFGLDVAGIDIISPDIAQPWHSNGAIVNEVNYSPVLGGGDISRRHIPEYLDRLLDGDGRIPVEVFVGGDAAWRAALGRQEALRAQGRRAFLSNADLTLDGDGAELPMPIGGLYRRARALVLSSEVEALVLAVQTDELIHTGLPLERVDRVIEVDRNVASVRDSSSVLPRQQFARLSKLVANWQRQH